MRTWLAVMMVALLMVGCDSKKEAKQQGGAQDPMLVQQASARLMQQGVQFLNARDIPKAVVSFQGAIQVNPQDLQPYMVLAEVFLRLKSYPDAINILERAANVFPDNGFVFYMLSIANQEANNPLPAVLAARRSAEIFKTQNNEEGYQRSMVLMEALIKNQQQLQLNEEQKQNTGLDADAAAPSAASAETTQNPVGKK
jgi:tetratricopeptide (TPR) repeat protein